MNINIDNRKENDKQNNKNLTREGTSMAQAFQATPILRGPQADKLIKAVMTSKPNAEQIQKLEKSLKRIQNYKK